MFVAMGHCGRVVIFFKRNLPWQQRVTTHGIDQVESNVKAHMHDKHISRHEATLRFTFKVWI